MNKTEHLGLSKWALNDPIKMEDFNEDNKKIDAAVAALAGKGLVLLDRNESDGMASGSNRVLRCVGDWNNWDCVIFLYDFPGTKLGDTPAFKPDLRLKTIGTFALPGCLIVLLPLRNAEATCSGFVIASGNFLPFSLDIPFREVTSYGFSSEDNKTSIVQPNITILGVK